MHSGRLPMNLGDIVQYAGSQNKVDAGQVSERVYLVVL